MSLSEFGERLKINLIKKWNQFENEKLEEDFPFYTMIEFSNKVPIAMEYKNIKLEKIKNIKKRFIFFYNRECKDELYKFNRKR